MKKLGFLLLVMAIALMLGGSALAQNVGDNSVYFTTYYSGNNVTGAPDATLRIINDGDTGADLYASIYVFDDSEELAECCSCDITPDGLLSESVKWNLTLNPITGVKPTRGVIKVISSSTESDASTKFAPNTPTAGLRVWATHVQGAQVKYVPVVPPTVPVVVGPWYVTETLAADSNLSAGEKSLLENLCYFDKLLSGKPCTCTPEDYDF
jgi:hypothetical protein